MVVKDGRGAPRAVIETLSLEQKPFDQVDWAFASAEGEGDETLDDWRASHIAYFTRHGGFAPGMMLWCERFRLVEAIGQGAAR
jgi:uncharacterized protein YhfF